MSSNLPAPIDTPIESPQVLTNRLAELERHVHLLVPFQNLDNIPAFCKISERWVRISSDLNDREVYQDRRAGGRLSLTKVGLIKIERAAGITWIPEQCGRIDHGTDPHYCQYRATLRIRDADGSYRTVTGEKEVDLREGSPQIAGMKPGDLANQRHHIQSLCETKAKLRAVRQAVGLQHAYSKEELERPFVVMTMTTHPPEDNPFVQQLAAAQSFGSERALYDAWAAKARVEPGELPAQPDAPMIESGEPPPELGGPPATPEEDLKRKAMVQRIGLLYVQKTGKTRAQMSPGKPPLGELSDEQLEKLREWLEAKPDYVPPDPEDLP